MLNRNWTKADLICLGIVYVVAFAIIVNVTIPSLERNWGALRDVLIFHSATAHQQRAHELLYKDDEQKRIRRESQQADYRRFGGAISSGKP